MRLIPVSNNQNFSAIHLFKYKNSQICNNARDVIKERCEKDWIINVSDNELLVLDAQDRDDLHKAMIEYRPDNIINCADYDRALLDVYKQKAIKIDLTNARDCKSFLF